MTLPVQKAVYNIATSFVVMGGYFYYVFGLHGSENIPQMDSLEFWGQFMLMMFGVTVAGKIILLILFTIVKHKEADIDFEDERDKLIEMKSDRNGNYFFFVGLMASMIPIALGHSVQYMFIILISSGFVAGLLGDLWKIYYYNKGV